MTNRERIETATNISIGRDDNKRDNIYEPSKKNNEETLS